MFQLMMEETNKETLRRIFRTDLSKLGQTNIQATQNTKNLKTKTDDNVLSALANQKKEENQQINPSMHSAIPGAQPSQMISPNSKRQPITTEKKVGRNEPCPCGSGKKYKKCHGKS